MCTCIIYSAFIIGILHLKHKQCTLYFYMYLYIVNFTCLFEWVLSIHSTNPSKKMYSSRPLPRRKLAKRNGKRKNIIFIQKTEDLLNNISSIYNDKLSIQNLVRSIIKFSLCQFTVDVLFQSASNYERKISISTKLTPVVLGISSYRWGFSQEGFMIQERNAYSKEKRSALFLRTKFIAKLTYL